MRKFCSRGRTAGTDDLPSRRHADVGIDHLRSRRLAIRPVRRNERFTRGRTAARMLLRQRTLVVFIVLRCGQPG